MTPSFPKKLAVGTMALMLAASMPMAAIAGEIATAGGTGSAVVNLDVEAPTFSVTVPTALPINVAADGEVTTSSDVKIVNNSHGSVIVTAVSMTSKNDWTIVDADKDMSGVAVNTKEFGMTINGDKTNSGGTLDFNQLNWAANGTKDGETRVKLSDYMQVSPDIKYALDNDCYVVRYKV